MKAWPPTPAVAASRCLPSAAAAGCGCAAGSATVNGRIIRGRFCAMFQEPWYNSYSSYNSIVFTKLVVYCSINTNHRNWFKCLVHLRFELKKGEIGRPGDSHSTELRFPFLVIKNC